MPIKYLVCEKAWFTINGPSKMVFFTQISNDYCQKSYNGFWGFLVISTTSKIFLIYTFLKMKRRPFFSICTDMHFVSLFFLNERNITTSLLMIHLKCTVVHYANLNSSSKNKPFLNYGLLNMLFRLFDFLFMFMLIKVLSKNLWNKYHFLIQIHFKM